MAGLVTALGSRKRQSKISIISKFVRFRLALRLRGRALQQQLTCRLALASYGVLLNEANFDCTQLSRRILQLARVSAIEGHGPIVTSRRYYLGASEAGAR